MESMKALESSEMWLRTAEAAFEKKLYPSSLYALEMATEIALKAVLVTMRVDVPKTHNMTQMLKDIFDEKRSLLPKEFLENEGFAIEVLSDLLLLRNPAGYAYETNISTSEFESKAEEYIKKTDRVLKLAKTAIEYISKKQKK
jgi:HEPN domain-containing protein